jgi:hypothetical protein
MCGRNGEKMFWNLEGEVLRYKIKKIHEKCEEN